MRKQLKDRRTQRRLKKRLEYLAKEEAEKIDTAEIENLIEQSEEAFGKSSASAPLTREEFEAAYIEQKEKKKRNLKKKNSFADKTVLAVFFASILFMLVGGNVAAEIKHAFWRSDTSDDYYISFFIDTWRTRYDDKENAVESSEMQYFEYASLEEAPELVQSHAPKYLPAGYALEKIIYEESAGGKSIYFHYKSDEQFGEIEYNLKELKAHMVGSFQFTGNVKEQKTSTGRPYYIVTDCEKLCSYLVDDNIVIRVEFDISVTEMEKILDNLK